MISMSPGILAATNELREFLFERVYHIKSAEEESSKARDVVCHLYEYFTKHEKELPTEYLTYSDDTERRVVDYIAGMTDQYALRVAEGLKQ